MKVSKIVLSEITEKDIDRPVLQIKKGFREYGIITGITEIGILVHFGMNEESMLIRGHDLFFVTFK